MWKNLLILILAIGLAASWYWQRSQPEVVKRTPLPEPQSVQETPVEPPPSPYGSLETILKEMQVAEGFEAASIGLSVFASESEPVFGYRAEEAMTPASTLKAVTSATAMMMLGADHQFTTKLATSVPWSLDAEGGLAGDLILVGGGDPMFTSVTLTQWVSALKAKGLRRVKGRVVADGRYFPEQMIPNAWDWGDVSNYYGAGPCGLNVDFNRFEVSFRPADIEGAPAEFAEMVPALSWLERANFTETVAAGSGDWLSIYGGPYASQLTIRGQVPRGGGVVSAQGAIPDPAYHGASQLKALLELEGISVSGEATTARRLAMVGEASVPEVAETQLTHVSETLQEIVRYLHRTSDNMVTECLFQELSQADPLNRSGKALVKTHWEKQGVPFLGLRMEDGSGLARADDIRPVDLAKVLWLVKRSPVGEIYRDTLNAYHGGRLRWKGGAMSRVRAYTGYSDNGYTFAFMINHYEANAEVLAAWRGRLMEALLALPTTTKASG